MESHQGTPEGVNAVSHAALHPLRFDPILRELIWGGRRLGSVLNKPIGDGNQYAESWEISDYGKEVSKVNHGSLAGCDLRTLLRERTSELLGERFGGATQFPLLVKYIDAEQDLSVQVHPDDEKGRRLAGDNGKTETWVVISARPNSVIYAGLKEGVTRGDFRRAIETGEVEPLLHRFPAVPGDCVFIPAGTVHAIGAGVLLAEIQQMSDATFRVFDWNRVGTDGKPRQLHVEQALESTDFDAGPVHPWRSSPRSTEFGTTEVLSRSEFFALERLKLRSTATVGREDRFTILMALEGAAEIESASGITPMDFGDTVLLPASAGPVRLHPKGNATILTCVIP